MAGKWAQSWADLKVAMTAGKRAPASVDHWDDLMAVRSVQSLDAWLVA